MNLLLIRHTRIHNPNNLCYGRFEIDLSNSFPRELEDLQSNISHILESPEFIQKSISSIYTSPSKRCTLLAEKLRKFLILDSKIITDERLLEYNFGDWEGVSWNEITESESSSWMNDFVNTSPPTGENMNQFSDRVNQFLLNMKNTTSNGDTTNDLKIVITHGGWIRIALAKKENKSLKNIFDIDVDYGSITIFKI